jgi:L-alanine-DL-glutamate epimerase-like enolase superfamily enzyme
MRLHHRPIEVHTRRTFKISVGARDAYAATIAELEHDGRVGLGEASPSRRVTGEDASSVAHFLDWAAREVADLAPGAWERFLDHVHDDVCGNPGARCALDLAVHDLVGKVEGVTARALYGLPAARIETSMTVSFDAPDVMAEEAAGYARAGFRCLKLKLGDAATDAARVEAVRRAAGERARLRADANTAWSVQDARRVLPALAKLGVEFVEQPVRADDVEGLVEVARASPLPVYADESVHDVLDVERLQRAGFRGGVNVKLQKAGGLRPALRALDRARELGFATQLGCNVETSIGISGAAQLLARLDHADLDGNALLADDPFEGAYPREGWLETPSPAGLGVRSRA